MGVMHNRSIWKNTMYNFLKTMSSVLFPLLIFPYVSRTLGPEGIGKYNFSSTYVSYYTLAASLGINAYAIRECAAAKEDQQKVNRIASEIYSINICTMIISYVTMLISLIAFTALQEYKTIILILSGNIIFTILGADWVNSAYEDFRYITIRTFAFQLLSLILIYTFVKKPDDCTTYAIISVVALAGTNICNYVYRRRYCHTKFTIKMRWRTHFPPIITLFVMLLVQTVFSNSDITIIGLYRGDVEVGLYSTAAKIFAILTQLIASVMWVVLPRLTVYFEKKEYSSINPLIKKVFQLMFGLGLPCIIGTALLSKEIIQIIGGEEYLGAERYLVLLMVALFFSLIGGSIMGNLIMLPSKRDRYFLIACMIAALTNIVLNLLFVPKFGATAAAITTIVAHVIIFLMLIPRIEKEIDFSFVPKTIIPPMIGCCCIAAIVFVCRTITDKIAILTCLSIFASIIVYFFVLYICKFELIDYLIGKMRRKG